MKSSLILLACFSLLGTVLGLREDLKIFSKYIDTDRCLGILPGNPNVFGSHMYEPVGYTLESFISIVEKIEYHHPQMDIFALTNMLLERFYFSNIDFDLVIDERKPKIEDGAVQREELLNALLPKKNLHELFREDALDDNEKCSLYFMIGHNINSTFRKGLDGEIRAPNTSPDDLPVSGQQNDNKELRARNPREQGVVSLHSDPINAVAIGRVLVGIAAGEYINQKRTLGSLQNYKKNAYKEKELDIVASLTVGDAIAGAEYVSRRKNKLQTTKYGPPGEWNSTSCPTDYRLTSMNISTTDAEMRGSIDGYILGQYVKELHNAMQEQLKLSRLIRMYYNRNEMKVGDQRIGFCLRSDYMTSHNSETVFESAEAVFIYYSSTVDVDEPLLNKFKDSFANYEEYLRKLDERTNGRSKGYHQEYNICTRSKGAITSSGKAPAEYDTPVDLFVVLDVSEHNTKGMQEQIDVVGHLAGHMDIGNGAGSVTVLLNSRGQQEFVKNETNSACTTCKLMRKDFGGLERDNLGSVLELLNRTLKDYEEKRKYEPAVPAKAVIFFHFDTSKPENDDAKRVRNAKSILQSGHRDVHIFAVGSNSEALGDVATGQNKFTGPIEPVKLADRIREEIKKVPATFQYHDCAKIRSRVEDENVYRGYVTPGTKQMWAMYPEHFLKSYNIEFRFKTEASNGKIKVCYSRDNYDPSLNDNSCKLHENGQEIKYDIRNPCEGRNRDTCKPFYFSVEGLEQDTMGFTSSCHDANCRRMDQIKFTVHHKGVACSGALGLLASPLILLGIIYATLRHL